MDSSYLNQQKKSKLHSLGQRCFINAPIVRRSPPQSFVIHYERVHPGCDRRVQIEVSSRISMRRSPRVIRSQLSRSSTVDSTTRDCTSFQEVAAAAGGPSLKVSRAPRLLLLVWRKAARYANKVVLERRRWCCTPPPPRTTRLTLTDCGELRRFDAAIRFICCNVTVANKGGRCEANFLLCLE